MFQQTEFKVMFIAKRLCTNRKIFLKITSRYTVHVFYAGGYSLIILAEQLVYFYL